MNPPTIGHEQVFKTMAAQGGDYKIFVSQTQDRKENPLSYSEKLQFIKAIHPKYAGNIVEDTNLNTIGKVASYLYDQGYRAATFVAGSDRLDSFKKLLEQYNGVEGKAHGYYKFEVLDFVSAGERDPDSPGVSGVSASKARAAAASNNLEEFKEATGAGEYAEQMFNAVRKGMGIKEDISEAPIEMDKDDPMDPMIYGTGANPGKLKYRMMRAAGQFKDLAARVDKASPAEWQTMIRQFDELKMNVEQIKHGLEELAKIRKKGGIRSRGIDLNIEGVQEGKFRSRDIEDKLISNEKLNDLKSKYLPDWEMLDHRTLQAKYVAKDHRHAEDFVSFINKISEEMDHFAEVTQDVAEVTVKTTTFDVKGLTILDFKLALKVDKFADRNEIEQVRMQGNFGMHEKFLNKRDHHES